VQFRRLDPGPAELTHDNLANVVSILVNTEGRDLGGVAGDIDKIVDETELPRGMEIRQSGEYQRMNESFNNLGWGMACASILGTLPMVAQSRSWMRPLSIMFAVPLGLMGVLLPLFVTGTTPTVQSARGIIFMAAIVVPNATLRVVSANRL